MLEVYSEISCMPLVMFEVNINDTILVFLSTSSRILSNPSTLPDHDCSVHKKIHMHLNKNSFITSLSNSLSIVKVMFNYNLQFIGGFIIP